MKMRNAFTTKRAFVKTSCCRNRWKML